ncbi:MAG: radical SAM protein [Bacteroidia bacterium]
MLKDVIYIEEGILDSDVTKSIIKNIGAETIIPIRHYKDIFNQSGSNWRLQKQSQKIILAKRTDNFLYKGADITPDFGFKHFYYNTPALNCIYDCDYCYLQGMFTSPHLVLFVNNNDFIKAAKLEAEIIKEPFYLALSYDTDLLALEHFYPYCAEWISFAKSVHNLTIEIRTKSVNINAIKHIEPWNNTILAWTLSPQEIINKFEPKTPNIKGRNKAIQTAIKLGWRVRICFDPILHVPDWKNIYMKMIDELENEVNLNDVDSYSLGTFRMNNTFLKNIQNQRKDTPILFDKYVLNNEVATYNDDKKNVLLSFVRDLLLAKNVTKEIALMQ